LKNVDNWLVAITNLKKEMEIPMQIYSDPNTFIQDSENKYLLRINSKECKVLLAALKSFNSIEATNAPDTSSLQKAINEIGKALDGTSDKLNGSYQAPESCASCLD